ncbi:MAG: hypothetical protein Fur002_04040 [Anaerolineales bacterium]
MRRIFLLSLLLLALLPAPARASASLDSEADFVPGQLIVLFKEGKKTKDLHLPEQARASAKKGRGLEKLGAAVIDVPVGQERAYLAKLAQDQNIRAVEFNYRLQAALIPNDSDYWRQYAPNLMQAETAWDTVTGAAGVTLAIVDSGIDAAHPEFSGRILPGYDFVEGDSAPQDGCGHGTHVAGIAAAAGNNAQGIAGIAWGVSILPVRVLDDNCGGTYADVASGLVWATDNGADVINLSLGSYTPSALLENATYYAYARGVAIFSAAGNDGIGSVLYPAAYDWVMALGSVDNASARAGTSNYGAALDLVAPGEDIYSTLPTYNGFLYRTLFGKALNYDSLSGTSMAAAQASGAAALLLSSGSACYSTPDQIYQALTNSAKDLGAAGYDNEYGYGLIQINNALGECPAAPPAPSTFAVDYDWVRSDRCALSQYAWRDASGGVEQVSLGNEGYRNIAAPFPLTLGSVTYNDLNLHANGFISMGNANTATTSSAGNYRDNTALPGIAKPNNFLAPFWDNLTDPGGAHLYTLTSGSAPNREFIVEYKNYQRVGANGSALHFEVVFFENSGDFLFQYKTLRGAGADGSSATIGVESENGLAGFQHSFNLKNALQEGLAIRFIPYASGSAALPSATCPQTVAVTLPAANPRLCAAAEGDFDVEISGGALAYSTTWKAEQLSAPLNGLPASFLNLQRYADLSLRYEPPYSILSSLPNVNVCYHYAASDLLAAGGHAENLFIAAYTNNAWSPLPTAVDAGRSLLLANAPHFSEYSVSALNPNAEGENQLGMPVTGAPVSREALIFLLAMILFIGLWLRAARLSSR